MGSIRNSTPLPSTSWTSTIIQPPGFTMNSITTLRPTRAFIAFGQIFARAFSSTPVAAKKHSKRRLQHLLRNVPTYPYPIQHTFKQSWFGLYGGKHIQFGNNVPESEYKTRRAWLPNVRHRSVFSRALNQHFSLDITASVLRMSPISTLPHPVLYEFCSGVLAAIEPN